MEGSKKNVGRDLMANFLSLVEQQQKLPPNHMMAMFGMYALVNILNLVQPETPMGAVEKKGVGPSFNEGNKDVLMDTLGSLLKNQGLNAGDLVGLLGGKSGSSQPNPGDLLGALGKNPTALMNFMQLLTSAKEAANAGKQEEKPVSKPEESKTIPFKERNP